MESKWLAGQRQRQRGVGSHHTSKAERDRHGYLTNPLNQRVARPLLVCRRLLPALQKAVQRHRTPRSRFFEDMLGRALHLACLHLARLDNPPMRSCCFGSHLLKRFRQRFRRFWFAHLHDVFLRVHPHESQVQMKGLLARAGRRVLKIGWPESGPPDNCRGREGSAVIPYESIESACRTNPARCHYALQTRSSSS
jgi:hypothetical protein